MYEWIAGIIGVVLTFLGHYLIYRKEAKKLAADHEVQIIELQNRVEAELWKRTQDELARRDVRIDHLETENAELRKKNEALEKEQARMRVENDQLIAAQQEQRRVNDQLVRKVAELNATNGRLQRELERVQSENSALRERVRKMEINTGPLNGQNDQN